MYVKCQIFDIYHTKYKKKSLILDVLNVKIFSIDEECNIKFESILFINSKTFLLFFIYWWAQTNVGIFFSYF